MLMAVGARLHEFAEMVLNWHFINTCNLPFISGAHTRNETETYTDTHPHFCIYMYTQMHAHTIE